MTLTEDQVWELWTKLYVFDCPEHPGGGCNPRICLECQTALCGDKDCDCEVRRV